MIQEEWDHLICAIIKGVGVMELHYINGFLLNEKTVINVVSGDSSREAHTTSSFTADIGLLFSYYYQFSRVSS